MTDPLSELRARLYLDQDVPIQLATTLRAQSVDAVTTVAANRLGCSDDDQLEYATAQGRAILTHNRMDFEALHLRRISNDQPHAGILVAAQRRDRRVTVERILQLLNRLDRYQLRNGLFYV